MEKKRRKCVCTVKKMLIMFHDDASIRVKEKQASLQQHYKLSQKVAWEDRIRKICWARQTPRPIFSKIGDKQNIGPRFRPNFHKAPNTHSWKSNSFGLCQVGHLYIEAPKINCHFKKNLDSQLSGLIFIYWLSSNISWSHWEILGAHYFWKICPFHLYMKMLELRVSHPLHH